MNGPDILIVTYCSRDKDQAAGMMPAVGRYLSPRIRAVHEAAQMLGADLSILSGLHGLLRADQAIACYDYLLTSSEVVSHAALIEKQMDDAPFNNVIFVSRTLEIDPGCGAYRQALELACRNADLSFYLLEFETADLEAGWLKSQIQRLLASISEDCD